MRAEPRGVRAFSLHPGMILTDLVRHLSAEDFRRVGATDAAGNVRRWRTRLQDRRARRGDTCLVRHKPSSTAWAACTARIATSPRRSAATARRITASAPGRWTLRRRIDLWDLSEQLIGREFRHATSPAFPSPPRPTSLEMLDNRPAPVSLPDMRISFADLGPGDRRPLLEPRCGSRPPRRKRSSTRPACTITWPPRPDPTTSAPDLRAAARPRAHRPGGRGLPTASLAPVLSAEVRSIHHRSQACRRGSDRAATIAAHIDVSLARERDVGALAGVLPPLAQINLAPSVDRQQIDRARFGAGNASVADIAAVDVACAADDRERLAGRYLEYAALDRDPARLGARGSRTPRARRR